MFGWFGRKSARGVGSVRLCAAALASGRRQAKALRAVMRRSCTRCIGSNPVGLRAVRLVAGAIGGLAVEAENDEAARLAKGVLEGMGAAQLLLHGNGYVQVSATARAQPVELFALRPERVGIAGGGDGGRQPIVYKAARRGDDGRSTDANGRPQVIHLKAPNPGDDHYGLGCLEAAAAVSDPQSRGALEQGAARERGAATGALVDEPGDGAA